MTTIGIDCRFAATHTGLGRYTRELVSALLRRRDPWRYVLFMKMNEGQGRDRNADQRSDRLPEWVPTAPATPVSVISVPYAHYSLGEQTGFPRILHHAGIDLLFSPHFNVPLFSGVPFVATIHDLILHRYPNRQSFVKQLAYRLQMKSTIRRARKLIAVSAFTKREITALYGDRIADRLSVVHEAVSPLFHPADEAAKARVRSAYELHRPFFLYVGNAKEHKNVQMLIDAFAAAKLQDHDLLLVTGGVEAQRLQLTKNVQPLLDVPDADLPVLYSLARCFVSASLYEGFGLPLLEAAACGCPAIVSTQGSFPEIAALITQGSSSGAVLCEPTVSAFADAIRHPPSPLSSLPSRRSWDAVASETADILFAAIANPKVRAR